MGQTAFPYQAIRGLPAKTIAARNSATAGPLGTVSWAAASTGDVLTVQSDGTVAFAAVSAGIGGSAGSVDNAILRADGTGGATLQASGVTISDAFVMRVGTGITNPGRIQIQDSLSYSTNPMIQVFLGGVYNGQDIPAFSVLGNGNVVSVGNITGASITAANFILEGGWGTFQRAVATPTGGGNRLQNAYGLLVQVGAGHGLYVSASTSPTFVQIYNTYTSDTSFERMNIAWASNVCTIEVTAGTAGGTLRGLRIGGAATSLLGFYGATPVDRPDTIADPAGGGTIDAEARTAINTIIDRLQELGLIA